MVNGMIQGMLLIRDNTLSKSILDETVITVLTRVLFIVKLGFDFFMMAGTTIDWKGSKQSLGNLTEFSVIAFHHRAIAASILIALTPIGLFGNALVISAVVVAKKLRTITNILVINLAFSDLVTCLCFPFLSAGLLSQTGSYPMHEIICCNYRRSRKYLCGV